MYAISLQSVSKIYRTYAHGWDRLWEVLTYRPRAQVFQALQPMTLYISHGQVVGIIGRNGAGKSTLLKIVAGTLSSDEGGACEVAGRVAALLELGSGFHPEMSGRENVYLSGAVIGLAVEDMDKLYDEIVAFAGLEEFMERPVKTYSSGMFMRLAFAVATCVEPDILIIDEALSVGDGAFARKSFDRIMQFREAKKTILFCSHSLYQVEKICDRVLWLDKGQIKMDGSPEEVLPAYSEFLSLDTESQTNDEPDGDEVSQTTSSSLRLSDKTGRISHVKTYTQDQKGEQLTLQSGKSDLIIEVDFMYDPTLLAPSVAVAIVRKDGLVVSSASTHNDNQKIPDNEEGKGWTRIIFKEVPLLKGYYLVDVYLACENALHLYDQAQAVTSLTVLQEGVEQGVITMPHQWLIDN
ncbi:MAG: ABC transporter ATP-binding protein [Gammaproteobacteria bacterium]|nr:MAG: ABC transporter ATP-binding protein [Gammaproteobacteria bacterium]RKZ44534.1 MAG: ABC transporter ATP-binding protein [Gammaproteobacteria bacterium]RKZ75899.1 MAG: ABC transporter ATP-binding protein [Gammaproteobacteria bacterium]